MPKRPQHVLPHDSGWAVRKGGAARVSEVFGTQREALDRARDIAQRDGVELFVHGRDGRIRERTTYGKGSVPAKG